MSCRQLAWLVCVVAAMASCERPQVVAQSAAYYQKWIRDGAAAQLQDARDWYAGVDAQWTAPRMRTEQQLLLTTLARMKTCELVQSPAGVPEEVHLNTAFWNAATPTVGEEDALAWQMWTQARIDQTLVATGLAAPDDWSAPEAEPVVLAVMAADPQVGDASAAIALLHTAVGLDAPFTQRLKRVMPSFPPSSSFCTPPATLLVTRPGS